MPVAIDESTFIHAKTLYCQNVKNEDIAAQTKVNKRTIETWATRHGWRDLRDKWRDGMNRAVTKVVKDELDIASKAAKEQLSAAILNQAKVLSENPSFTLNQLRNTPDGQGNAAILKTVVESADKLYGWSAEAGGTTINQALFFELPGEPEKSETVIDVTPQDAGNSEPQA